MDVLLIHLSAIAIFWVLQLCKTDKDTNWVYFWCPIPTEGVVRQGCVAANVGIVEDCELQWLFVGGGTCPFDVGHDGAWHQRCYWASLPLLRSWLAGSACTMCGRASDKLLSCLILVETGGAERKSPQGCSKAWPRKTPKKVHAEEELHTLSMSLKTWMQLLFFLFLCRQSDL